MVITRSQTARITSSNTNGTDRYSDTEGEGSVPEVLTRDQMREFDNGNLLHSRNELERLTVIQRFSEMNKQITELTNLVFVLTEKISSSNREGNDLNTVSIGHETRSDRNLHKNNQNLEPVILKTEIKSAFKSINKLQQTASEEKTSNLQLQCFEVRKHFALCW